MKSITPCLWFDGHVDEAIDLYTTVFPDSELLDASRYPADSPGPEGEIMMAVLRIKDQELQILNGGPAYKLSPAISLSVSCDGGQEEVDRIWDALLADGGEPSQCGWLTDRFGLSWQIVPVELPRLMGDPDPEKSQKVMQAMLKMAKIEIAELEAAYNS